MYLATRCDLWDPSFLSREAIPQPLQWKFSLNHWVSRESSQPGDWARVSRIAGRRFTVWAKKEAL